MTQPRIFLAIPSYGGIQPETMISVLHATMPNSNIVLGTKTRPPNSLLARGFNELWCDALNSRKEFKWTHFAMIHADVDAQAGWLDILYNEMQRTSADVISTVLMIKDYKGETSTGLYNREERSIQRFRLSHCQSLPKTFSIEDVGDRKREALLVNTGLFLCRFTEPWIEPPFCFEIKDWIVKVGDKAECRTMSEDWNASMFWDDIYIQVFATTAVRAIHMGRWQWPNYDPKKEGLLVQE